MHDVRRPCGLTKWRKSLHVAPQRTNRMFISASSWARRWQLNPSSVLSKNMLSDFRLHFTLVSSLTQKKIVNPKVNVIIISIFAWTNVSGDNQCIHITYLKASDKTCDECILGTSFPSFFRGTSNSAKSLDGQGCGKALIKHKPLVHSAMQTWQ